MRDLSGGLAMCMCVYGNLKGWVGGVYGGASTKRDSWKDNI